MKQDKITNPVVKKEKLFEKPILIILAMVIITLFILVIDAFNNHTRISNEYKFLHQRNEEIKK